MAGKYKDCKINVDKGKAAVPINTKNNLNNLNNQNTTHVTASYKESKAT